MKLIVVLLLFFFNKNFNDVSNNLSLQITLHKGVKGATLSYIDTNYVQNFITFRNTEDRDTVILKQVKLRPYQILTYSLAGMKNNLPYLYTRDLIVAKQDTIKLDLKTPFDLKVISGVNPLLQDYLNLLPSNTDLFPKTVNMDFLDLNRGIEMIDSIYTSNKLAIKQNKNSNFLSEEIEVIDNILKIDYYLRLYKWVSKNNVFSQSLKYFIAFNNEKENLQAIDYPRFKELYASNINWLIKEKKIDSKNVKLIIDEIFNLNFKKNLTLEYLKNVLPDLSINRDDARVIYNSLKSYANDEYNDKIVYLIPYLFPSIKNTSSIILRDLDGKQITFQQLLSRNNGKLLLIDFWASWCKPCREQAPFFEKNKAKFSKEKVVFLSISLDEDDKILDWKKSLKEDGLINASGHYKLVNPKYSSLLRGIKINEIPRYIIINSKGDFIDPNFPMPSDKAFPNLLLDILRSQKD